MKQTAASSQESRQEACYNDEPYGMSQQFSGNTAAVYYDLHLHSFSVSCSLLNIQQFSFSSPSTVSVLEAMFSSCQVTAGFL